MSDYSDLDRQIEQLKSCQPIKEYEVKALCAKAREILVEEGNVQRIDSPVTVSIVPSIYSPSNPSSKPSASSLLFLLFHHFPFFLYFFVFHLSCLYVFFLRISLIPIF
jgi:diadenosine tetraphosphatase ApaH/serine/threonine PP2A family protein phosphatase